MVADPLAKPRLPSADELYLGLLNSVMLAGDRRPDRTGTGTASLFGATLEFDLSRNFPLLTTKRLHWKSIVHELLWMLRGDTNIKYLNENGVRIWDEWADSNGDLGPVYGAQWRRWDRGTDDGEPIDQLAEIVENLRTNPYSRRHILSAWNVGALGEMALPPCHALVQFYVSAETNELSCQLYQRSGDIFLGVPFNIASYALLTCILADKLGFGRGVFRWVGGDVHLYDNHREQALLQLSRGTKPGPVLQKLELGDPLLVKFEEIVLTGYRAHPSIPAPVAV